MNRELQILFFLSEVNCTLLKERLKRGQNLTENQPLRTPVWGADKQNSAEKKMLKLKLWHIL